MRRLRYFDAVSWATSASAATQFAVRGSLGRVREEIQDFDTEVIMRDQELIRHACYNLEAYRGSSVFLYDEFADGVPFRVFRLSSIPLRARRLLDAFSVSSLALSADLQLSHDLLRRHPSPALTKSHEKRWHRWTQMDRSPTETQETPTSRCIDRHESKHKSYP
ncbi:hypothetical protein DEQ92_19845 [Haloferax sp. Atlit-6N]|nr:hypothetical protein DEQ92_19845 [Haloferax sp. Atlit-6N]